MYQGHRLPSLLLSERVGKDLKPENFVLDGGLTVSNPMTVMGRLRLKQFVQLIQSARPKRTTTCASVGSMPRQPSGDCAKLTDFGLGRFGVERPGGSRLNCDQFLFLASNKPSGLTSRRLDVFTNASGGATL